MAANKYKVTIFILSALIFLNLSFLALAQGNVEVNVKVVDTKGRPLNGRQVTVKLLKDGILATQKTGISQDGRVTASFQDVPAGQWSVTAETGKNSVSKQIEIPRQEIPPTTPPAPQQQAPQTRQEMPVPQQAPPDISCSCNISRISEERYELPDVKWYDLADALLNRIHLLRIGSGWRTFATAYRRTTLPQCVPTCFACETACNNIARRLTSNASIWPEDPNPLNQPQPPQINPDYSPTDNPLSGHSAPPRIDTPANDYLTYELLRSVRYRYEISSVECYDCDEIGRPVTRSFDTQTWFTPPNPSPTSPPSNFEKSSKIAVAPPPPPTPPGSFTPPPSPPPPPEEPPILDFEPPDWLTGDQLCNCQPGAPALSYNYDTLRCEATFCDTSVPCQPSGNNTGVLRSLEFGNVALVAAACYPIGSDASCYDSPGDLLRLDCLQPNEFRLTGQPFATCLNSNPKPSGSPCAGGSCNPQGQCTPL